MQDILAPSPTALSKARLIAKVAPDLIVLSGLDHDHVHAALTAFAELISAQGHDFPYRFALASNAGLRHEPDPDPTRRRVGPDDTQGYGPFAGARALALLSRYPIETSGLRDFTEFLWRDLPGNLMPDLGPAMMQSQRLSSTGHWDLPVTLGSGRSLRLLIYQAGPPVFGDAQHTNRLRNHDETAFWTAYLEDQLPWSPPQGPFVLLGGSNLDPYDGDGMHQAIQTLLRHPRLQDPRPESRGAREAATSPRDKTHRGPPEQDTVHWPQERGPGNLRVSYVLPSSELRVTNAGVFWPAVDHPDSAYLGDPEDPPTRHRLVWVDIDRASLARDALN